MKVRDALSLILNVQQKKSIICNIICHCDRKRILRNWPIFKQVSLKMSRRKKNKDTCNQLHVPAPENSAFCLKFLDTFIGKYMLKGFIRLTF